MLLLPPCISIQFACFSAAAAAAAIAVATTAATAAAVTVAQSSTSCGNLLSYFCAIPKSQFNFIYVSIWNYLANSSFGSGSSSSFDWISFIPLPPISRSLCPPCKHLYVCVCVCACAALQWNCWRKWTTKLGTQLHFSLPPCSLCPPSP